MFSASSEGKLFLVTGNSLFCCCCFVLFLPELWFIILASYAFLSSTWLKYHWSVLLSISASFQELVLKGWNCSPVVTSIIRPISVSNVLSADWPNQFFFIFPQYCARLYQKISQDTKRNIIHTFITYEEDHYYFWSVVVSYAFQYLRAWMCFFHAAHLSSE